VVRAATALHPDRLRPDGPTGRRLFAGVEKCVTLTLVDSRELLARVFAFEVYRDTVPMINSSFVHRNVIDRVKRKQGRYFFGFSLDFTAGLANAAVTDKFMRLSRPLSISAYSRHRSGYHFLRQETNALGSGRMKRDFGTIPTDRRLPGLNKLELVHANDMLAAKGRLFPEDDYICLDFTNLLREIAANINDRPQLYENTLAMMSQLAEQHNLDIARVIIPPRAERTPTWKSGVTWAGPHKMHFVADGNVFGMQ